MEGRSEPYWRPVTSHSVRTQHHRHIGAFQRSSEGTPDTRNTEGDRERQRTSNGTDKSMQHATTIMPVVYHASGEIPASMLPSRPNAASSIRLKAVQSYSSLPTTRDVMESPSTISPTTPLDIAHGYTDMVFGDQADVSNPTSSISAPATPSETISKFSNALQETSYFLGGLLSRPTESTKHFTILRHGHGLVFYQGSSTSVAITTFSDKPLPLDRRYWLQVKGWIGNTGMKVETLFRATGDWVDVTPARRVSASDLPQTDERAWQRDNRKFVSQGSKASKKHCIRETAVLRVPAEVRDGYLRVVLTKANKKDVLCASPVFRVASTSASAGSVKGASLTTLPIELGINIMQFATAQTVNKVAGPWMTTAQKGATKLVPQSAQAHLKRAYTVTDAQTHLDNMNIRYQDRRTQLSEQPHATQLQYKRIQRHDLVGDLAGPQAPFPILLRGSIVKGSGRSFRETGMPTINIADFASEKIAGLFGVYLGWAFVFSRDQAQVDLHSEWRHAIITITHDHHGKVNIAPEKVIRTYLLHNYGGEEFFGSKISIVVMGYLRSIISHGDREAFFTETLRDVEITRGSLERQQWGPILACHTIKKAKSERSLVDRYVDARMAAQRRLDTVPVHRVGIRSETARYHDRALHGNGGLYAVRDGL